MEKANPGRKFQTSPELSPLPLVVADEVPELAGVDVAVNRDQEILVVFEGAGELLHQLPHALQELIDNRRHLFGVSRQLVASGEGRHSVIPEHTAQKSQ